MSQTKAQLISDLVQALNFTGTSSAPANGMYLSAANTIKLATNSNGRLTIDSSGNAVFTGTCTATTFIGAVTGTASGNAVLTGSTNNQLVTVTGANAITGEANLTYNGNVVVNKSVGLASGGTLTSYGFATHSSSDLTNGQVQPMITASPNATNLYRARAGIAAVSDGGTAGMHLAFMTRYADDGSDLNLDTDIRWRIRSNGHLESYNTNIYLLRTGTTGDNDICFGDSADDDIGRIRYDHDDNHLSFLVNTSERLRITSDGMVGIGVSNPAVAGAYAGMEIGGTNNTGLRLSTTHASGWAFTDYEINGVQKFIAGCRGGGGTSWRISTGASLDSNVKVNVTVDDCTSFGNGDPSAWQTGGGYYNLQLGNAGYLRADTDASGNFFSYGLNTYRDSSGWKFIEDGRATQISHGTGTDAITFYGSNSGTADGSPTFFEMLKLKVDGDVVCGSGNLVLTDGQGIDFSADGNAGGMTNELLDDYEEGTWTPTMGTNAGGSLTATYNIQTGTYTKIGRMVYILFDMTVSNTPTGTAGYPQVRGLPFAPTVGQSTQGGFPIPQFRDSNAMPVDARLFNSSYGHDSDMAIWIQYWNSSGVMQQPAASTWWSSGRCQGEMVYQTTA